VEPRRVAFFALLLSAISLGFAPVVQAEFKVAEMKPRVVGEAVVLNGNLELGLTPKVEEALSKGIELPIIVELRLYRKRSLLWDQRVASWSLRRNLQYHALSGQYLVNADNARDNFLSLAEALKHLGTLSELRLPLPTEPAADEHVMTLRVYLDIEALPTPLRPVAYTTLSWHLNSGWTKWNVQSLAD